MGFGASFISSEKRGSQQDVLKKYFLCKKCEGIFGVYEKYFKENVYEHLSKDEVIHYDLQKVKFFILSVAWCYLQYVLEQNAPRGFEHPILEIWRIALLQENHQISNVVPMYLIPLERISHLQTIDGIHKVFSTTFGFHTSTEMPNKYVAIKMPKLFLLCFFRGDMSGSHGFQICGTINHEYTSITQEIHSSISICLEGTIEATLNNPSREAGT